MHGMGAAEQYATAASGANEVAVCTARRASTHANNLRPLTMERMRVRRPVGVHPGTT